MPNLGEGMNDWEFVIDVLQNLVHFPPLNISQKCMLVGFVLGSLGISLLLV